MSHYNFNEEPQNNIGSSWAGGSKHVDLRLTSIFPS